MNRKNESGRVRSVHPSSFGHTGDAGVVPLWTGVRSRALADAGNKGTTRSVAAQKGANTAGPFLIRRNWSPLTAPLTFPY